MKNLYLLYFTLLSFCVLAQKKEAYAIQIQLEDAETGKNIDDAKVTLEGFEIPALTAKYDKTGKVYYFTKIPAGYNTVMAYHKKYNEKGFQNVAGLPKELKLKLYDPLNVSYSFESNTYKDSHQTIYVEDPYKVAIFSSAIENFTQFNDYYNKGAEGYNQFKDYLYKEIEKLDLDIEVVNPYLELVKNTKKPYIYRDFVNLVQKEAYPYVKNYHEFYSQEIILPMTKGYSTTEYGFLGNEQNYIITPKRIAFYFRKKDGTKFKRYNDPFLKKIRNIKGITTASVIYYKYYFEAKSSKRHYKSRYTKELDNQNSFKEIDSSKVFFYQNYRNEKEMNKPTTDWSGMPIDSHFPITNEDLIPYLPNILTLLKGENNFYEIDFSKCNDKIFEIDQGIGLGILDRYETISDCLKRKFLVRDLQNNYDVQH